MDAVADNFDWEEWSNTLAQNIPEEYDTDIAQEAIIENFIEDASNVYDRLGAVAWYTLLKEVE